MSGPSLVCPETDETCYRPLCRKKGCGAIPDPVPEQPKETAWKDGIERPTHYARFPIEPVTMIMMNDLPFWAGNVVKYACRAPFKDDEEADIRKIIRYAEMRLEQLKRERESDRAVVWNPL